MKIKDLKDQVDQLKAAQESIINKRDNWQNVTKPTLIRVFNELKDTYNIGWHVQILDWINNSEGVNISFGASPSGISEKTDKSLKAFIKRGGALVFSQAYNGDVFIIIIYPSVDELVSESESKVIGRCAPSNIDEEFIVDKVSTFLDELTKWEKATYGNPIGFN